MNENKWIALNVLILAVWLVFAVLNVIKGV